MRDFMPVRLRDGSYASFRYEPSYLKDAPEQKTSYKSDLSPQFSFPVTYSEINLDGGNVVFSPSKEKAIISDRVFSENPEWERAALLLELERLLKAQIIVIPSLHADLTGHADGMVRFVDENTVLGNFTPYKNGLEQRIKRVLEREGLTVIDFPYYDPSGISAEGCYLNFLETEQHIFLPIFGHEMDKEAIRQTAEVFSKKIVSVQINGIAKDGGGLHCISWED